ncbi:hypothetical protein ACHAXR_000963, partial [Thalassiosira sp. AJA248-18]
SSAAITAFERLERDVGLNVFYAGDTQSKAFDISKSSKLRLKSTFRPPLPPNNIDSRLSNFDKELKRIIFEKKVGSNLSYFQNKLLNQIQSDDYFIIANANKGLGPVGIELSKYIKWGLKHLTDRATYVVISEEQVLQEAELPKKEIFDWTIQNRQALTDDATKFIRSKLQESIKDPFGYFYLLIKLHKTPISTRPVCSDCASLPHALGQWVDEQLQPIVKAQPTYFKNSFTLKQELDRMTLPVNASLFTYDAVSMYTKIITQDCIARLSEFLLKASTYNKFQNYSPKALIDAIKIVMLNNRMRFGDIIVRQLIGIAMGMSPAPSSNNCQSLCCHPRSTRVIAIHRPIHFLPTTFH